MRLARSLVRLARKKMGGVFGRSYSAVDGAGAGAARPTSFSAGGAPEADGDDGTDDVEAPGPLITGPAGDEDAERKRRGFAKRAASRAARRWCAWCSCCCACDRESRAECWHVTKVGYCVVSFVVLVMFIVSATTHVTLTVTNVVIKRSIPTEEAAAAHAACVSNPACDLCSLELMFSVQPRRAVIALLAPLGTGGLPFRQATQQATRVRTTSDVCDVSRVIGFNPDFATECTTPLMYTHSLMTSFERPEDLTDVLDYEPNHLIMMSRDPFAAAMWAYHITKTCTDVVRNLSCDGKEARLSEFATAEWADFALASARAQMRAWAFFDASATPKRVVHYEDLRANKMETLTKFFDFVAPPISANPSRGVACAMAFKDNSLMPDESNTIPVDAVFDPDLTARMCAVVQPRWDAARWGPRCAPPGTVTGGGRRDV